MGRPAGLGLEEAPAAARPLVQLAAEGGATLLGLRLADGTLMLRIEQPGRSVQVRLPAGTGAITCWSLSPSAAWLFLAW